MAVQNETKEKSTTEIKKPKKYQVIMLNDDFTPMDFVVEILIEIFHKSEAEAVALMYMVHRGNQAVVGEYTYDIAKTKTELAIGRARQEGYPFEVILKQI